MNNTKMEKHYRRHRLKYLRQPKYQNQLIKRLHPKSVHEKKSYDRRRTKKYKSILEQHKVLFDGELGSYPHKQFNLKLKEGAVPVHKKPYPVPHKQHDIFCCELHNLVILVKDGVLCPVGTTNWASSIFIILIGDNRVQWEGYQISGN